MSHWELFLSNENTVREFSYSSSFIFCLEELLEITVRFFNVPMAVCDLNILKRSLGILLLPTKRCTWHLYFNSKRLFISCLFFCIFWLFKLFISFDETLTKTQKYLVVFDAYTMMLVGFCTGFLFQHIFIRVQNADNSLKNMWKKTHFHGDQTLPFRSVWATVRIRAHVTPPQKPILHMWTWAGHLARASFRSPSLLWKAKCCLGSESNVCPSASSVLCWKRWAQPERWEPHEPDGPSPTRWEIIYKKYCKDPESSSNILSVKIFMDL